MFSTTYIAHSLTWLPMALCEHYLYLHCGCLAIPDCLNDIRNARLNGNISEFQHSHVRSPVCQLDTQRNSYHHNDKRYCA